MGWTGPGRAGVARRSLGVSGRKRPRVVGCASVVCDAYEELADVGAVEQHVDRGRELFEAFDHGLQRVQPSRGDPVSEFVNRFWAAVEVVEHEKTLQTHALDQQSGEIARAGGWLGVV